MAEWDSDGTTWDSAPATESADAGNEMLLVGSKTKAALKAHGCNVGLRAVVEEYGAESLDGQHVLIQGVGAVGGRLATLLKEAGAKNIIFLCLLAAPEGVARMKEAHPDVPIVTAALDSHLNELGYIVPGLGDAGDRMFGTK